MHVHGPYIHTVLATSRLPLRSVSSDELKEIRISLQLAVACIRNWADSATRIYACMHHRRSGSQSSKCCRRTLGRTLRMHARFASCWRDAGACMYMCPTRLGRECWARVNGGSRLLRRNPAAGAVGNGSQIWSFRGRLLCMLSAFWKRRCSPCILHLPCRRCVCCSASAAGCTTSCSSSHGVAHVHTTRQHPTLASARSGQRRHANTVTS